jgi:hypothetical protein
MIVLPDEIIYYIYTFDVEHRPKYRKVMIELHERFILAGIINFILNEITIELNLIFDDN